MSLYRATLVWGLRGLATAIVCLAAFLAIDRARIYYQMRDHLSVVELAAMGSPYEDLPKLAVVAGGAALLVLTLSEILSLLTKRYSRNAP